MTKWAAGVTQNLFRVPIYWFSQIMFLARTFWFMQDRRGNYVFYTFFGTVELPQYKNDTRINIFLIKFFYISHKKLCIFVSGLTFSILRKSISLQFCSLCSMARFLLWFFRSDPRLSYFDLQGEPMFHLRIMVKYICNILLNNMQYTYV